MARARMGQSAPAPSRRVGNRPRARTCRAPHQLNTQQPPQGVPDPAGAAPLSRRYRTTTSPWAADPECADSGNDEHQGSTRSSKSRASRLCECCEHEGSRRAGGRRAGGRRAAGIGQLESCAHIFADVAAPFVLALRRLNHRQRPGAGRDGSSMSLRSSSAIMRAMAAGCGRRSGVAHLNPNGGELAQVSELGHHDRAVAAGRPGLRPPLANQPAADVRVVRGHSSLSPRCVQGSGRGDAHGDLAVALRLLDVLFRRLECADVVDGPLRISCGGRHVPRSGGRAFGWSCRPG